MLFGEMQARVVAELGLDDEAIDEPTLVKQLLNEGVVDVLKRTRCVVRCVRLHQPADETQFVLNGILSIEYIEPESTDPYYCGTRLRKGSAYGVRSGQGGYALLGQDLLLLPEVTEERWLKVFATPRPTAMSDPLHDPAEIAYGGIATEFQPAVCLYAFWKGSSYTDDQSGAQGERYRVDYEGQDKRGGAIREIRRELNKKMEQRPPRKRVGLRPLHSRGSYVG